MDEQLASAAREFRIGIGSDEKRRSPFYLRVNGKKSWFDDEGKRERALRARIAEIRRFGVSSHITDEERAAFIDMRMRAQRVGRTVTDIFSRGIESLEQGVTLKRTPIPEAVNEFLAEQQSRSNDGLITAQHYRQVKHILLKFSARFQTSAVSRIDHNSVHKHLRLTCAAVTTRNSHARMIGSFFNWAIKSRITDVNPTPRAESFLTTPKIFTVEQAAEFFAKVKSLHPETTPMFALQWFAGMRPEATHHIEWPSIDFEHRHITVRAEINKTREPELIEDLPPDQLWDWLVPYRQPEGRIAPAHWKQAMQDIHGALGYSRTNPWPTDVARHTFASHLVPVYRSLERVGRVLLHRGTRILLKHYMSKNVTRAQGEAYLRLRSR